MTKREISFYNAINIKGIECVFTIDATENMKKVYVDGANGLIGSKIFAKLKSRRDIELFPPVDEADVTARVEASRQADIVFLSMSAFENNRIVHALADSETVLIDATGSRNAASDWVYGFAEMNANQPACIASAKKISVPSPFAVGFLALIKPLVDARIIPLDMPLSCFCISGYSIGGEDMVARYKFTNSRLFKAPRQYGLTQNYRVLGEIADKTGLKNPPLFSPIVCDFYSGMHMSVQLPIFALESLKAEEVKWVLAQHYGEDGIIRYNRMAEYDDYMSAASHTNLDSMEISAVGNAERMVLHARYDNLGKGAAGAAIECMNLVLGVKRSKGLNL